MLARTWRRLLSEVEHIQDREDQIEAARKCWSDGFFSQEIDRFIQKAEVRDASGLVNRGVLSGEDMQGWQASYEVPVVGEYSGWSVAKTGPWGQGPVLLQTLSLLQGFELGRLDLCGTEFVHTVCEAMKLAYADREAYYGDPDYCDVPLGLLLSDKHAANRISLIGERAPLEQRPSILPGYEHLSDGVIERALGLVGKDVSEDAGEPTMAHLSEKRGDTVHLDVIDRWGNVISVTPSGGWLQSNPVIPELGFALNSRAQMFWLDEGLNQSLTPGARPRTTLSPSLAWDNKDATMAFGTPGGDQQDQWQLILFLRHVHGVGNLQACMDMPLFHSQYFNSSFYPRTAHPGGLMIEPNIGEQTIKELRKRGHIVDVAGPWTIGRLTAAKRYGDGTIKAAATPRLMQAYAVGR